jgi:hypothetical protein
MVHLLRTTFINSHNTDFWILTSNTLHTCPQPRMVHLLWTICCYCPNTDLKHYFEQLATTATAPIGIFTSNFASITPIPVRIWILTSNTWHPCPLLRLVHLLRTLCYHSPNTDLNHTLKTLHPCTLLRLVHLLRTICCHSPSTDLNHYFKHFSSMAAAFWNKK